ncbi:IgGFc-binding protein-like [Hyla sarda]|uniref:IgGFc-binding protein-like n=1 Tax=Hyla sarda TaxID=327740 RepID=UPI0024C23DED|nr:IgGFc-binding protein-like [Hyla sarda]
MGQMLPGGLSWRRLTSKGTYFLTMFMQNTNSAESPGWEMLVTGTSPSTSVTISVNKSNFMKTVKVGKGETVTIEIPNPLEKKGTGLSPRSISIKASAEITVMTRNYKKTSGDVASIYPVDQWGVEYYIITPYNGPSNQYTEFGVLASDTATSVTMVLSGAVQFNGKNYQKGDTLTVNLEPSQFVQVQSKDDLSGTKVTSQYPTAVLSGHTCAPSNGGGCGHVYEQLKPVESWGTSYFIPGLSFQSEYDQVYVMAPKATCIHHQSGGQKVKTNIAAGNVMRVNVSASSPFSIHSNDRIQILFNGRGGKNKGKSFGPFLTKIPDIDSFDLSFNLIRQEDFDNNMAVMIAKTSSAPGITLNGNALQNAKWTEFPESEYSWAEYDYGSDSSSNRVQHPTSPFGLLSIGYSMNKAYGSVAPDIQAPGASLPEPIGNNSKTLSGKSKLTAKFLDDDKK